ncbi:MAG: bifunctional alpha/beta hydrolase/class I SAM-dependent methyltransferase [Phycisphaeraceae bacterium]
MLMTEHRFVTHDGVELAYLAWLPQLPATRAVLLFHRGHEHAARWDETVGALTLPHTAFFALDQRGHGHSPGERGFAPSIAALTQDADAFARHIWRRHAIAPQDTAVIASSVGAVIAAAWVHDFAPTLRAMVLAAPAFDINLYVPFAVPSLRLKERFLPGGTVKSYVKSRMLTHSPEHARAYDADALIFRQISIALLLDLYDTGKRLVDDAAAIRTPTLIVAAGRDYVVKTRAQKLFYQRLGSKTKQFDIMPGAFHALFQETNRPALFERTHTFLEAAFAQPSPCNCDLVHADRGSFTRTEYDLLRIPGPAPSALPRLFLRTVGRLSRGISLGWKTGFDSGQTLDYIYQNRAGGFPLLGTLIDRNYLNAVGWRGIRIRKQHLDAALRRSIEQLHAAGQPVHIMDIASGPGRYVLEAMHAFPHIPTSALLRDYRQDNLAAARSLADSLHLHNVTTQLADAFERVSFAAVTPKPTIAIASGIYELFPDNGPVLDSLGGIADALDDGGHLLYTGLPWHPQVEFMARVLTNREGKPWIMRRRSQAELDALVHAAGFEKIDQHIDNFGIYTVSLARRTVRTGL